MKDAFGKNMQVGDEVIHFYSANNKVSVLRATITGFTPQRVRFAWEHDGRAFASISVPTNFALVPAGFDEHAADRQD